MDRETLMKRHEELRALRQFEESAWNDIAEMLSPEDAQFYGQKTKADYGAIYDSTPLYAHDDFVSGLFGQATNPANRWFKLGNEDEDLAQWKPVKDWLYASTTMLGGTFRPSVSPFYAQAPSWFADIGAFGNGGFFSEERPDGLILDLAVPLRELYIDRNDYGNLDTVHRQFMMPRRRAAEKFPGVEGLDDTKGGDVTIIHAVFPNPSHNLEKIDSKAFLSIYCSPDVKTLWRVSGYHEMPYQVPGWARGAGRVWSRGPGHRARADMRTLNEMERTHLVAAAFAAEPPLLLHQDSDLTAADVVPAALLYGSISENGKEMARALNRSQNLQLSMQQSEQRRKSVRDAFYFSMMQVVNRPQMTATEVLGYKEENLRLMGPNLARIQTGGLSPLIARRFKMLERAGALPPPPKELEGRPLTVEYVSPLALAQKASEGRAVIQLFQATMQMAQAKPGVLDNFDEDAAYAVLHEAYGTPPSVMRDPAQVQEDRANRAGQQQRQDQLADASQQVQIAATASHAAQAASLSNGRRAA